MTNAIRHPYNAASAGVSTLATINAIVVPSATPIVTLAVVLSSLSYASGGVYGQLQVRDIRGPVLAAGNMLAAAVVLAPVAIVDPPTQVPGIQAVGGLAGLIVIPTFAGQLLLFRVLALFGSRKLSIVTYLMPAFAVVYGAVLLGEAITTAMLAGFALILLGVALASGQRLFEVRAQEEPA